MVTMVTTNIVGFRAKLGNPWSLCNYVRPSKITYVIKVVEFNGHGLVLLHGVQGQLGELLEPVQPGGTLQTPSFRQIKILEDVLLLLTYALVSLHQIRSPILVLTGKE